MTQSPFDLWLEFDRWLPQEGRDLEENFFNQMVTLQSGKRYALNVWTFKYLSRAIHDCWNNGECLGGAYLIPPDLFVERLDRNLIERVVADLIARGGLQENLEVHDPLVDP
jgi:hypothetical protein